MAVVPLNGAGKRIETLRKFKPIPDLQRRYPKWVAALLDNRTAPELDYTRAYAQFMVDLIKWRGNRHGHGAKAFFSKSYTHGMMCFTLLSYAGEAIVRHGSARIGVPLATLHRNMKAAEGKTLETINGIIKDALEAGLINKTYLATDKRCSVYYLERDPFNAWLDEGVKVNSAMAVECRLADALRNLADMIESRDTEISEELQNILDAAKLD